MLNHHQCELALNNLLSFNKLLPIDNDVDHTYGSAKRMLTYTCLKVKLNKTTRQPSTSMSTVECSPPCSCDTTLLVMACIYYLVIFHCCRPQWPTNMTYIDHYQTSLRCWPYLDPIKIAWWYLKRFKSYRDHKQINKQVNKQTVREVDTPENNTTPLTLVVIRTKKLSCYNCLADLQVQHNLYWVGIN